MKVKKSRWLVILMVVAMLFSLVPAVGAGNGNDNGECEPMVVDLIAGQDMVVGTVTVTNDDEQVCVTYALDQDALDAGWLIYETHLYVGDGEFDGVLTRYNERAGGPYGANPIPGQFPYKQEFDDGVAEWTECVEIPGEWDWEEYLYIAAHAVIERIVEDAYCETEVEAGDDFFVSDTETMVVESDNFGTPFAAELAWVHPFWNDRLTYDFDDDAEWIWESFRVDNPIEGDVVTFEREFEVPGPPLGGTLQIAADNGFAVYLNGEFLEASPTLPQYPNFGDPEDRYLTEEYVNSSGWQNVQEIDLTDELVQGDNTLTIVAANEYMGPLDGQSNGTIDSNPGGVIFEFGVCWDEVVECYPDVWEDETAWGEGDRFNERGNWGMFFKYELCIPPDEVVYPESGTITVAYEDLPLDRSDWDYNDWVATIETVGTFQSVAGERYLTSMEFDITPKARGAAAEHEFGIKIPEGTFSVNGNYTLVIFDDEGNEVSTDTGAFVATANENFVIWEQTSAVLPDMSNTDPTGVLGPADVDPSQTAKLSIVFDDDGCGDFDFADYPEEDIGIHGEGMFFDPYINSDRVAEDIGVGDTRMIVVPDDWRWPTERTAIWDAYDEVDEDAGQPTFVDGWWDLGFDEDLVY